MKFQKIELKPEEWSLLFQGAESRVYRGKHDAKTAIWKERFVKEYRHPELDKKLTRERIKAELKAYEKLQERCPDLANDLAEVLYSDDRNIIFTELPNSINVSFYIDQCSKSKNEEIGKDSDVEQNQDRIKEALKEIAKIVSLIHKAGIVHGDLTTSNFLVNTETRKIVPIDFGLSFGSTTDEDRAVDLYVLECAIESTHPSVDFQAFLSAYEQEMGDDKALKKLDVVRQRGRKRICIG